jgi:hypothetical protein
MIERLLGGRRSLARPYGPPMKTHSHVAPRSASIAVAGGLLAIVLAACSPGVGTPLPIGSQSLPSIDASAIASAAAGAALTALDQVDAAITANTSSTGLTADDASSLTQLTAGVRTALQSGDTTAARTAVDSLATKVDSFAAKLNNPTGQQLTAAIAALKALLPAS